MVRLNPVGVDKDCGVCEVVVIMELKVVVMTSSSSWAYLDANAERWSLVKVRILPEPVLPLHELVDLAFCDFKDPVVSHSSPNDLLCDTVSPHVDALDGVSPNAEDLVADGRSPSAEDLVAAASVPVAMTDLLLAATSVPGSELSGESWFAEF